MMLIACSLRRVNHSCDANTLLDFDPAGFVVGLRTTRMIKIGEEITFSYIIPFQKRRERKEELLIKVRAELVASVVMSGFRWRRLTWFRVASLALALAFAVSI